MTKPKLTFVTGNANKLAEVRAILGDTIELDSRSIDLPELQGTIEEISKDKCRRAASILNAAVLVEDTCLCFEVMGEMPGPYIKWFLQALGPNNLYKMLEGFENKTAIAVCTFAYCKGPDHDPIIFQGRTYGNLVPARGPQNFGWDCAFEYEGRTYAEMPKEEKNIISHRGKALKQMQTWFLADNSK